MASGPRPMRPNLRSSLASSTPPGVAAAVTLNSSPVAPTIRRTDGTPLRIES